MFHTPGVSQEEEFSWPNHEVCGHKDTDGCSPISTFIGIYLEF